MTVFREETFSKLCQEIVALEVPVIREDGSTETRAACRERAAMDCGGCGRSYCKEHQPKPGAACCDRCDIAYYQALATLGYKELAVDDQNKWPGAGTLVVAFLGMSSAILLLFADGPMWLVMTLVAIGHGAAGWFGTKNRERRELRRYRKRFLRYGELPGSIPRPTEML
jgi:hypothetical protein